MRSNGKKEIGEAFLIAVAVELAAQIVSSVFDEWRRRRNEKREREQAVPEPVATDA